MLKAVRPSLPPAPVSARRPPQARGQPLSRLSGAPQPRPALPSPGTGSSKLLQCVKPGVAARGKRGCQTEAMVRALQRQVKADNPLGALVKILLPGPALYLPALLIPSITIVAALGAWKMIP